MEATLPIFTVGTTYPYLKFDTLVIPKHCLDLEIDADGRDKGWSEGVVGVAEQERRLADTAVADNQQLEHVVEVLVRLVLLPSLVLHRCSVVSSLFTFFHL